jgi:hypothetical protein
MVEQDKFDWQSALRETKGVFEVELLRKHYDMYGAHTGPFTNSSIKGLKEWFVTHLRALKMKTSIAGSNKVRYQWLCAHYFVEERMNANPANYHAYPFKQFGFDARFARHFFSTAFLVFDNKFVKFFFSMFLVYQLHYVSHTLYMTPLPLIRAPLSCVDMPLQYHCPLLVTIQNNTFSGIQDMGKTIMVFLTTLLVGKIANFVDVGQRL